MASLPSRRLAHGLTWTFNFATRSRNLSFSFTLNERLARQPLRSHRSYHPRRASPARPFSTYNNFRQETHPFRKPTPTTASGSAAAAPPSAPTSTPPKAFVPKPSTSYGSDAATPTTTIRADPAPSASSTHELRTGLSDLPEAFDESGQIDWARSFHGLSAEPFSAEAQQILMTPIDPEDIEIRPEGLLYLPEIKYRRILNKAFGAGGWGLAPRGETIVTAKSVTREYALVVHGRLVSVARGEQDYFDNEDIPMATEGCKSIALRRCCKDIGIASELWDPRFLREFNKKYTKEVWVEHVTTKKKRKLMIRKDESVKYPYKEVKST